MNADDRTTPANRGLYTPRAEESADQGAATRSPFMPVSQAQPTAAPAPAAPTTGSVPQRTAKRPSTGSIPTSGTVPTTGQQPTRAPLSSRGFTTAGTAFAPTAAPAAPAPTTAPAYGTPAYGVPAPAQAPLGATAGAAAVLGGGTAKIKDLAGRAAESFKAGDDLATPASKGGPRKARVLLSRIDPWSALKLGFLLSIAMGIMLVVAVFVIWNVLNSMGTFTLVNDWVVQLFTTQQETNIMQFVEFNKVMSAATLIAVVNVVLLTALSAIGAFLYNVVSSVVGGVYVTLTDD